MKELLTRNKRNRSHSDILNRSGDNQYNEKWKTKFWRKLWSLKISIRCIIKNWAFFMKEFYVILKFVPIASHYFFPCFWPYAYHVRGRFIFWGYLRIDPICDNLKLCGICHRSEQVITWRTNVWCIQQMGQYFLSECFQVDFHLRRNM